MVMKKGRNSGKAFNHGNGTNPNAAKRRLKDDDGPPKFLPLTMASSSSSSSSRPLAARLIGIGAQERNFFLLPSSELRGKRRACYCSNQGNAAASSSSSDTQIYFFLDILILCSRSLHEPELQVLLAGALLSLSVCEERQPAVAVAREPEAARGRLLAREGQSVAEVARLAAAAVAVRRALDANASACGINNNNN